MKYQRILLKLSGESLQGAQKYGLSTDVLQSYAEQIKAVAESGVQIGIVIGGGNIFRGLQGAKRGFDNIGRVEPATKTCFEHYHITILFGKKQKSHCSYKLKLNRIKVGYAFTRSFYPIGICN